MQPNKRTDSDKLPLGWKTIVLSKTSMLLHGHFFWPKVSVAVRKFNSPYSLTSQKCFAVHTAVTRFEGQISDLFSQAPHEALRMHLPVRRPPTGTPSRSNTSLTNYPIHPSIDRPPPSQNKHIVIDVFDHGATGNLPTPRKVLLSQVLLMLINISRLSANG